MKSIRIITIGVAVAGFVFQAQSQQLSQFSQYIQNEYMINPAAAGVHDWTDINMSMRRQWAGLNDAPQTYYVSGNHAFGGSRSTPLFNPSLRAGKERPAVPETGDLHHAVAGYIATDKYGAFGKTSFNGTYAIHLPLTPAMNISAGIGLGVSQLTLDQSMITLEDNFNDQTYNNFIGQSDQTLFMDVNMGLRFYTKDFYVGYSNSQSFGDNLAFGNVLGSPVLKMHHFVTGGYYWHINQDWLLIPNFLMKMISPAPISFDLNVITEYKKQFWGGLSYRAGDALVVLAGAKIKGMFKIGYSYDFTTTDIKRVSSGSHEVVLGLMLGGK